MTAWFLFRLMLDFLAVSLLIVAFLYDWLGNVTHEIVGTVILLLLVSYNVFNRHWWGRFANRRQSVRSGTSRAVNLSLALAMVALLVTSVVISQAVFSFLPMKASFRYRQVHTLVAYVALMTAGVHLGLHWSMIMGVVRVRLGLADDSKFRTFALRLVAGIVGVLGIRSTFALDLASKLSMQVPMGFAAFEMPTPILLLHHLFLVGVSACTGHYSAILLSFRKDGKPRGS